MTIPEDKLLEEGLAALGASFSPLGRGPGARFAARRLKTVVHEQTVELPLDEVASLLRVRSVLSQYGQLVSEPPLDPNLIQAVLGGGVGGLNPVVVTVTLATTRPGVSVLNIRTAAKEGMIKQHSSERMAARVSELLAAPVPR